MSLRFIEDFDKIYVHAEPPIQGIIVLGKCPVCEKYHSFPINKCKVISEDGKDFFGVDSRLEVTSDQHSQQNYVELRCGHHVLLEELHPDKDFPTMEDM